MKRIQFKKNMQKKFLNLVMQNLNCPNLRNLLQFGLKVKYATLKNYYTERRCLPQDLFDDLCFLAKIDKKDLNFKVKNEIWGQVKGGMKSKRTKNLKLLKK